MQLPHRRRTIVRFVSQALLDQLPQGRWNVISSEGRALALDELEHDLRGSGAEGMGDGGVQHLPARHAEGEHVAERGYGGAVEVLGRDEHGCTAHAGLGGAEGCERLRKAVVCELDVAAIVGKQYVGGLDVGVQDAFVVGDGQAKGSAAHDVDALT